MKNTTVCTVCLYLRPKGFEAHASGDGWLGEFGWERYVGYYYVREAGCVCVCVFFPFILGIKFVGHHTGFLIHLLSAVRALIFVARRIQPFLSLVDREVEFCVLTI